MILQCLRCGREIDEREVFCADCLDVMAKHPVKPNTVVTIPERTARVRRAPVRRTVRPEETAEYLRRKILQLRLWVCVLMAALMISVAFITWQELSRDRGPSIGQNYTSMTGFQQGGR